ncbi:MAG: RNA methyltransferase [Lautropia sp.]|nr:RNA methyltransferase [Lautropia sp.]
MSASPPIVTSAANPRFKRIRSLIQSARERRREAASVLEGIHLVGAWLAHRPDGRQPLLELALAQRALASAEIGALVERGGVQPLVIEDRLFDSLGTMPSPVPVLALVTTPKPDLPDHIDRDTVVLDRIQDPGNVGAILRSAAAAGIARVVTTPQTAWCWSPKVLRAAMGGHFGLSIHESHPWSRLAPLIGIPLAGALAHGGVSLYDSDLCAPCVWVFGNEGDGPAAEIEQRLDWRLTIPQTSQVESLNVAAAAAVCLFEQRRQRLVRARSARSGA